VHYSFYIATMNKTTCSIILAIILVCCCLFIDYQLLRFDTRISNGSSRYQVVGGIVVPLEYHRRLATNDTQQNISQPTPVQRLNPFVYIVVGIYWGILCLYWCAESMIKRLFQSGDTSPREPTDQYCITIRERNEDGLIANRTVMHDVPVKI
jgi:hypothetical protein